MNYLYQSHGAETFHRMTLLSISSLLRLGVPGETISVVTDTPAFFASTGIQVLPITSAMLRQWRGRFDFVHRAKLEAIRHFRRQGKDGATVYVDSDTAWIKPLDSCDRVTMYELDTAFPEKIMAQYRAALTKGGFYLDQPLRMYNAGLIGLPADFPDQSIDTMLKVSDWLCLQAPARMNWAEQLAVAMELATFGTIQTVERDLIHYWYQSFEFMRVTQALSNEAFSRLTVDEVNAYLVQAKALAPTPENRKLLSKRKRAASLKKRGNEIRATWWRLIGSH